MSSQASNCKKGRMVCIKVFGYNANTVSARSVCKVNLDLYLYARWYAQCVNLDNEMPRIEYQLHRFD